MTIKLGPFDFSEEKPFALATKKVRVTNPYYSVVSSSGYGDGGYSCYIRKNDAGMIVEAVIVFIAASYEDEEDEEDENDDA